MNISELRFGADVCRSVLVVVLVLALGKPVTAATQLATGVEPAITTVGVTYIEAPAADSVLHLPNVRK